MWYFDRLPDEKKTEVLDLYTEGEFLKIMDIYNEFKVSPDFLTPCCSIQKLVQWTNWAKSTGALSVTNT